jgi:cobalt-zinc-cadmium efflux system outer membrane protein
VRFLRDGSDAAFVAGISIPLPVRDQNQGDIRAARAKLAGAEQTTRAVEAAQRVALAIAWRDFKAAHSAAQNLRRDALPATEEAHTTVRRAYNQGELPLLEVLDAQRALSSIRRDILDAEAACVAALIRAEALTDLTFPLTTVLLSSP